MKNERSKRNYPLSKGREEASLRSNVKGPSVVGLQYRRTNS